ncbi:MAG: type II toxin-antitoxin system HicB family antitoxin [Bosea sp. (in: a-proteobacteria)]
MVRYVGILDGANDVWGVTLPDIDGCVGAGATPEEAIESVTIALREVASHVRSSGHDLPMPGSLSDILAGGEYGFSPVTTLIPLLLDSGRTVRANVTFDAGLLDSIDSEAKRRGLTRSAFLASAAREKISATR